MPHEQIQDVVVIGAGVAGSTLAIQLARAGRNVIVIDRPHKMSRVVGESLLPATVPILRLLGVEDEVKEHAMVKPGVAFIMRNGRVLQFNLQRLQGLTTTYSYNVPRPRFEQLLKDRLRSEGTAVIAHHARPRAVGDRVVLDANTLDACGLRRQPDLVVDCSGRAHLIRRLLGIGGVAGKRHDTCLFAHFEDVDLGVPIPGCAVMTVMNAGWCWRIPLPDRMSIGVIQTSARLKALGRTPPERLEAALRDDPTMAAAVARGRRVTDVQVFNNYQWVTQRFRGANWALVGDTAGFVDPTLSSGVLIAMQGALGLARAITDHRAARAAALARWERTYREHIVAWQDLVDYFYDGRLFASIMQGEDFSKIRVLGPLNRHIERRFAGAVLGATTTSWYSRRLIRFLINKTARYRPADLCVQ